MNKYSKYIRKDSFMEIFKLLEELEELLAKATSVPFTNKAIVDKEQILNIIKEIRLDLPDELKQAKWIREERERIIAEAHKDADGIVKEAENRIISMIDEHEITKKAYEKKSEIISQANEMYRDMNKEAMNYADGILNNIEKSVTDLQETLNNVELSIKAALENIQNDRKELK